ncbi:MAG: hypothetical protein KDC65_13640 [Saprospiraceae bacterium]|nr:hypothetical protein [Saprospiraceae bacterium]
MQKETEFYIGWQAEAPPGFARKVRQVMAVLVIMIPAIALLIVVFQRGFADSRFEFGQTTVLEGIYEPTPAPFLSINNGSDASGKPVFQKILLVARGKFGFLAAPGAGNLVAGQKIRASGFLIYHDGKTAFEVETIEPQEISNIPPDQALSLGAVTLRGEVTDPKCLLGVMKPGYGKPHRDCAVRCIAGGIPPVLKVTGETGETEYYLLAGDRGQALNDLLIDYVADAVQICGRLEQDGDWLVLYADTSSIHRMNKETLHSGSRCND